MLRISLIPLFLASINRIIAAEPIYLESFDKDPGYVIAKGPNDNNISSISFGAAGSPAPHCDFGQFAGTAQYGGTPTKGGKLVIGSNADTIAGKSRSRSYLTVIDTSTAEAGQYRVRFDVSDFKITGANTPLRFHLYEGSGTDKGFVDFRLTSQSELPELARTRPEITTGKGATAWQVLSDQEITGNGEFSVSFGLRDCGKPGDYLALVWTQAKKNGLGEIPSMSIDQIEVSMLPKPEKTSVAEEIPAAPFGQSGTWKISPLASDEFNAASLDPRKWNHHPPSWGAWSWSEENVQQKSGKLELTMTHDPHNRNGTSLFYKSGIVKSQQQMTYGYYEARIKGCSLFPGACPAFWMFSDGRKNSGEVRYCEIDFIEIGMGELNHTTGLREPITTLDMNLHLRLADAKGKVSWLRPNSHPELCANLWRAPWDPREDFHIYACHVTAESITWFIDGKAVAKKTNRYWHEPMNITFSLGLRHPHIGWVGQDMKPVPQAATEDGFPTTMEIDWIRVWENSPKPSLPSQ